MKQYPVLEIHEKRIFRNAVALRKICEAKGITVCGVVKGFCNQPAITKQLVKAGYRELASSRIAHLKEIKEAGYPVSTLLLRIPMACEIPEVVRYADCTLISERFTLDLLEQEAARQGKTVNVILMRDVGDLREGIFDAQEFIRTACDVEAGYPHLFLKGVGTNLTCYGSVNPTPVNLGELAANAAAIEAAIGRKLEVVSGGSTSTLPLVISGSIPKGISHLRVGEALVVPWDLFYTWGYPVPEMTNAALILKAQIIELGDKPTKPVGEQGINCFGSIREYPDLGIRRRAIVAMGEYDFGNYEKLVPCDPGIRVLGASSDHTILDIEDSTEKYRMGDIVEFELRYQSMLFTTSSVLVTKEVIP